MTVTWHDDRGEDVMAGRRPRTLVTTHRGKAVAVPITLDGHITGTPREIEAQADRDNTRLFWFALSLLAVLAVAAWL